MSFELELRDKLLRLAECRMDLVEWKNWWATHSTQVKEIVSPGDFIRLQCASNSYGPDACMLNCQESAERYLTKIEVPFVHSDLYAKRAAEEQKRNLEDFERKRQAELEEKRRHSEQAARKSQALEGYQIPAARMEESGLRTLPMCADDLEIIKLLIEWTELMAAEKYEQALTMFQHYNQEVDWTPALLESAVYSYGCPGLSREEAERLFGSSDYKITSLLHAPDRAQILEYLDIDYDDYAPFSEEKARRCGLTGTDYENILGMVHYDVPLNGEASDLTAIFYIKKLNEETMTLSFFNLHVM